LLIYEINKHTLSKLKYIFWDFDVILKFGIDLVNYHFNTLKLIAMKIKILFAALTIGIMGMVLPKMATAQSMNNSGVNFQVFYNELSPYGDWIMDNQYGYLWVPNVGRNFHPYGNNGYWTMTNYGNTWVSLYDWGWAPFHYGRWFWDDYLGWAWIPGYEWSPAWVTWRSGSGYFGWAPLGPNINITIGFNAPNYWVFVPQRKFRHRMVFRHNMPQYQTAHIFSNTTVINNTYIINNRTYYAGPSQREIEKVTRRRVSVYDLSEKNQPGRTAVRNNNVEVYRPSKELNNPSNSSTRPSRVLTREEYRSGQRTDPSNKNGRTVGNSPTRTIPSNNNKQRKDEIRERPNIQTEERGVGNQIRNDRNQSTPNISKPNDTQRNDTRTRELNQRDTNSSTPRRNDAVSPNSSVNTNSGRGNSGTTIKSTNPDVQRRNSPTVNQSESQRSNRSVQNSRKEEAQPNSKSVQRGRGNSRNN
jgi:hypothetical protein